MFKNFKLAQCDNFLYGAYAWFALALITTLYLIGKTIDPSSVFVQGLSYLLNLILLLTALISGVVWNDVSMTNVGKLMEEKSLLENEKYKAQWEDIKRSCNTVGGMVLMFMTLAALVGVASFMSWLIF